MAGFQQDRVALEREMRECLTEIERRQSLRQKSGIPPFVSLPKWTSPSSPTAQVLRGAIAFVVLMLIGAGFAAVLLPDSFHFARSTDSIGVPIGVPESASTENLAQNVETSAHLLRNIHCLTVRWFASRTAMIRRRFNHSTECLTTRELRLEWETRTWPWGKRLEKWIQQETAQLSRLAMALGWA